MLSMNDLIGEVINSSQPQMQYCSFTKIIVAQVCASPPALPELSADSLYSTRPITLSLGAVIAWHGPGRAREHLFLPLKHA